MTITYRYYNPDSYRSDDVAGTRGVHKCIDGKRELSIPPIPGNTDWDEYLEWVKEGGTTEAFS